VENTVYFHTNARQFVGAKVSEYSIKKASRNSDKFGVKIIHLEDSPHLLQREGQTYLREGRKAVWRNDDLQSFTPLRFLPPQFQENKGRAVVIDPDVFATRILSESLLLSRLSTCWTPSTVKKVWVPFTNGAEDEV